MSAMIFIGAIPSITNPMWFPAAAAAPSNLDDSLFNIASSGSGLTVDSPATKESLSELRKFLQIIHVFINMCASLVLLVGVKSVWGSDEWQSDGPPSRQTSSLFQRARLLLLPWIIWTGTTVTLCLVWIGLTLTSPMLTGDLLTIVIFSWAELCVVSHYQVR